MARIDDITVPVKIKIDSTSTSPGAVGNVVWTEGDSTYTGVWTGTGTDTITDPYQLITAAWDEVHKTPEREKGKDKMKVYEIVVVDRRKLEIIVKETVIAQDQARALAKLNLNPPVNFDDDAIEVLYREIGGFDKYVKPVRIETD